MLIVALPLSPCAFFSSACCEHESASPTESVVSEEACPTPERACCAHHSQPVEKSAPIEGQQPCKAECCQLSPFVPQTVNVAFDVQPMALALVLPQLNAISASPFDVPSLPLAATPPLQILHCQWRL
jgi:hypothetical protein